MSEGRVMSREHLKQQKQVLEQMLKIHQKRIKFADRLKYRNDAGAMVPLTQEDVDKSKEAVEQIIPELNRIRVAMNQLGGSRRTKGKKKWKPRKHTKKVLPKKLDLNMENEQT